eukprot:scaffold60453_cov55-Phaeocystis_antarctica.AAC.3
MAIVGMAIASIGRCGRRRRDRQGKLAIVSTAIGSVRPAALGVRPAALFDRPAALGGQAAPCQPLPASRHMDTFPREIETDRSMDPSRHHIADTI